MTVIHDFTLLAGWDDAGGWSGSNDVTPTAVSEPRLEGTGAISIVKSGTSEQWFYAEYQFQSPVDLSNKVLVFYLYVGPDYIGRLDALRVRLYDSSGNYYDYNLDAYLRSGRWQPIIVGCYTALSSSLNWGSIARLRITFHTLSASNTFPEGAIVVDRLLAGTGFYVLYSSAESPDTIEDVALADERDNLMLVERVTRHLYIVRAPIYVGDGEHTGALYVRHAVVVGDPVGLYYQFLSLIMVNTGSWFKHEGGLLVNATRDVYPYGAQILNSSNAMLDLERLYIIDARAQYIGITWRLGLSGTITLSDVLLNTETWAPGSVTYQGLLGVLPHGLLVYNFLGTLELNDTVYLFDGATLKSREGTQLTATSVVAAGGTATAEHAVLELVNPVNLSRSNLSATGASAVARAYYDVDIYITDRLGNPLVGVTVKVYNYRGDQVGEAETDEQGHVSFTLLVYEKQTDSSGNLVVDEDYNPFTVEVFTNDGNLLARTRMEVRERLTYYVTPEDVYAVTVWPGKPRVETGEPVELYLEVRKADGTPVSGLDAYVDVETPDHTIYTVSLSEDSDRSGIYRGEFTDTSWVGTYGLTGYVVISGVRMEARNQFEAGTLEARILEVRDLLRRHDAKLDAYKWL